PSPFFVCGSKMRWFGKSRSSQRKPIISPRRIPVQKASASIGRNQSGHPSRSDRISGGWRDLTRPTATRGDFTPYAGLSGIISHSRASRNRCFTGGVKGNYRCALQSNELLDQKYIAKRWPLAQNDSMSLLDMHLSSQWFCANPTNPSPG